MIRLTHEIQEKIVRFLQAGGFPEVAAQAAGVPREVFARWLRWGVRPKPIARYRDFVRAIHQAMAQARLGAEVAIHGKKPLDWLKNGPGRSDWGQGSGPPREEVGPLSQVEYRELVGQLLQALEEFPEARQAAAEVLVQGEKKEKREEERA
jgi:hypothetical protein